ncbi:unnamed protein product [Rhizopus stolonifer]
MENLLEEITFEISNIERFVKILQEEDLFFPKAAAVCSIPRTTAYRLLDEFNNGSGSVLLGTILKPKTAKHHWRVSNPKNIYVKTFAQEFKHTDRHCCPSRYKTIIENHTP